MKIQTTKEKLEPAVFAAEQAISKNPSLPVLKCILLEVKKEVLIIRSTNLDLAVHVELPVKVLEEGVLAVPGTILKSFLSNIPSTNISLESAAGNLLISTKHSATTIKCFSPEDFPKIPDVPKEDGFVVDPQVFARGFRSVWYSAAVSSAKPELSSIYLYEHSGEIIFAATDSFRLAEKKIKVKKNTNFVGALIPLKNVPEIIKILEGMSEEAEIWSSKNQLLITSGTTRLLSRVIEGVFPDYKQIIPREAKTEVVLLKQDLLNAMKATTVFSGKLNQMHLEISPTDKKLELSAQSADLGENANTLPASLTGEDLSINFNHKYFNDCFQSIESDSVSMQFSGIGHPAILKGVSDRSFMYIVMPMNK